MWVLHIYFFRNTNNANLRDLLALLKKVFDSNMEHFMQPVHIHATNYFGIEQIFRDKIHWTLCFPAFHASFDVKGWIFYQLAVMIWKVFSDNRNVLFFACYHICRQTRCAFYFASICFQGRSKTIANANMQPDNSPKATHVVDILFSWMQLSIRPIKNTRVNTEIVRQILCSRNPMLLIQKYLIVASSL